MDLTNNKITLSKKQLKVVKESLNGRLTEIAKNLDPPVSRSALSQVLLGKTKSERILKALIEKHYELEQERILFKQKLKNI